MECYASVNKDEDGVCKDFHNILLRGTPEVKQVCYFMCKKGKRADVPAAAYFNKKKQEGNCLQWEGANGERGKGETLFQVLLNTVLTFRSMLMFHIFKKGNKKVGKKSTTECRHRNEWTQLCISIDTTTCLIMFRSNFWGWYCYILSKGERRAAHRCWTLFSAFVFQSGTDTAILELSHVCRRTGQQVTGLCWGARETQTRNGEGKAEVWSWVRTGASIRAHHLLAKGLDSAIQQNFLQW